MKRSKILKILSLALLLSVCFVLLFSCKNEHLHKYDITTTTVATCTEKGAITYVCQICGDTYTEEFAALGHSPNDPVRENVVDPDCTTNGEYDEVIYCTRCSLELSREKKASSALGHAPNDPVRENVVDPDCTTNGSYEEVVYCLRCGFELSREEKVIFSPGHRLDAGVVIVDPTYTTVGERLFTCLVCGEQFIEEIPVLSDTVSEYRVEYYLERTLEDGYDLRETVYLHGDVGETVYAEIKEYEHYIPSSDSVYGTVLNGGQLVLRVYYDLERFNVRIVADTVNVEISTRYDGLYKFGTQTENVVAIFKNALGCEWRGWYKDGEFCSKENLFPSFIVERDVTIIASGVKEEMKNYTFTSSSSELTITGVIDKSIESVTIPSYVTAIGKESFAECTSLTELTIPKNVKSIGENAFILCTGLKKAVVNADVTEIPVGMFAYCSLIEEVTLPSSVKRIGAGAFSYCYALKEAPVFEGITSIGDNAFFFCWNIVSLYLPDSLLRIEGNAFSNCLNLVSVRLGENITSIDSKAFYYDYKLVEVINDSALTIKKGSLDGNGQIGYYALTIHTGESVIENDDGFLFLSANENEYLVGYVGAETELVLPENRNGNSYIVYDYAFAKNDFITSVTISSGVSKVGTNAFDQCKSLCEVTIAENVKDFGKDAFINCYIERATVSPLNYSAIPKNNLKEVTIIGTRSIPERAFYGCGSLESVTISSGIEDVESKAFGECYSLIDFYVAEDNPYLSSSNGVLYNKEKSELIRYAIGKTETFTIPTTVTAIRPYAFENATCGIVWSENTAISNIGAYAFANYDNQEIILPDTVTYVDENAFSGTVIKNAIIPAAAIGFLVKSDVESLKITRETGSYRVWLWDLTGRCFGNICRREP